MKSADFVAVNVTRFYFLKFISKVFKILFQNARICAKKMKYGMHFQNQSLLVLYFGAMNRNEKQDQVVINYTIAPRILVKPSNGLWPDTKTLQWFKSPE